MLEPFAADSSTSSGVEHPDAYIGPAPHRRKAREWALVLQSMNIDYSLLFVGQGWMLRVPPPHLERALAAIRAYEAENADWPPVHRKDRPRYAPSPLLIVAFAALVLFFFAVTGPAKSGSVWFVRGTADASLLWTEPWRMLTALTLHADAKHVLGNAIAGSIFGSAVSRRLGPGGALLAIAAAGMFGNGVNALYHLAEGHRSIGASTAVFGAVGLLAALQMVVDHKRPRPAKKRGFVEIFGPLVAGLALLGALGASPQSDLYAHLFGFLVGALIGMFAGFAQRRNAVRRLPRGRQLIMGILALGAILGSWQLALALG